MMPPVALPDKRPCCAEDGCGDEVSVAAALVGTSVGDVDGIPDVEVSWNKAARSIVYEDASGKAELSEEYVSFSFVTLRGIKIESPPLLQQMLI
jgi:hypothetical protein